MWVAGGGGRVDGGRLGDKKAFQNSGLVQKMGLRLEFGTKLNNISSTKA